MSDYIKNLWIELGRPIPDKKKWVDSYDAQAKFYAWGAEVYRELRWWAEQDLGKKLNNKMPNNVKQIKVIIDGQVNNMNPNVTKMAIVREAGKSFGAKEPELQDWDAWLKDKIQQAEAWLKLWVSNVVAIETRTKADRMKLRKDLNPKTSSFEYFVRSLNRMASRA